ncbi:hypothetical protein HZH68_006861 [Vespula germanica]|uniref:Uncharacterized protein n=1 Tax=Vespula germanica TaxID=30212 RepID=A0A834KDR3_VESGE|nr:hypothetical protein HZH68_006861 [Vespula germanica]
MALEEEEAATKKKCIRIRIKLWSGDTELRETTTNSSVRPILTGNGSHLLRISTNTHRRSRSMHSPQNQIVEWGYWASIKLWSGDTELRETTTNSSVRPILTGNGSHLLRISTNTHRRSRKLNYGGGDAFPPVTPIRWILTAAGSDLF